MSEVKTEKCMLKIFLLGIATAIFLTVIWVLVVGENANYRQATIDTFASYQESLLDDTAAKAKTTLQEAISGGTLTRQQAEQKMVNNVIKKSLISASKYYFLFSGDTLIFQKDDQTTNEIDGAKIADLIREWKLQGGQDIEGFETLLAQGKNGTQVFSKNSQEGQEIVSIEIFTINNVRYILGLSTLQDYVLRISKTSEHTTYINLLTAVFTAATLLLSLSLGLKIFFSARKNNTASQSIFDKNNQIHSLEEKLTNKSDAAQKASIYDSITGLYNPKFFDAMLPKLKEELFWPVSTLVICINGLATVHENSGYFTSDELLVKIANIVEKSCIETDISARTNYNEITIMMVNTEEDDAYAFAENIRRQFLGICDLPHVSLSFGVAQAKEKGYDIDLLIEDAHKNLNIEKLRDPNSDTFIILALLKRSLVEYTSETEAHCDRIKVNAMRLGRVLGLPIPELAKLDIGAQLHDIGKIGIPDSILHKKGPLTKTEREVISKHPEIGCRIAKTIPNLDQIATDILQHHENFNGTGYPQGLVGEEITMNARIIAVVDSFDAMTHTRVYSAGKSIQEAADDLAIDEAGRYDPHVVKEFLKLLNYNKQN